MTTVNVHVQNEKTNLPKYRTVSFFTTAIHIVLDTFRPLARFFRCFKNKNLIKLWLAIIAFQSYAIVHLGQINTLVLYFIGPPYQWDSEKFGVFAAVAMAVAAIGAAASPIITSEKPC
jgi:cellulose synthase/poly-beta-1,6-N-acetylglucosamine synthase-like glycosyltransferase